MDALKSLLSDLRSTVRDLFEKIRFFQFEEISGDDKNIVVFCTVLVSASALALTLWELPLYANQLILYVLMMTSFLLGFCNSVRAKTWGVLFFIANTVIWWMDTYRVVRDVSGVGP
ncbi:hypothetical protein bcgnr5379_61010 [Bacillus cereus]